MATITPSFLKQGTCGSTGDIYTCFRWGNSGASSTADLGGSGSGSDYRNTIAVRFDSIAKKVSSASLTITINYSSSDYKSADIDISIQGSANFTSSTNGTAFPTQYGDIVTGTLEGGGDTTITFDVTSQLNSSIENGARCLAIWGNAANNRKRISSLVLTYTELEEDTETTSPVRYNGQYVTDDLTWKQLLVSALRVNGVLIFPILEVAATQPTSAMTSNTAPSPYIAYFSSRYSTSYAAWRAFRNTIDSNGWASASGNSGKTAWIALDLGSGNKLREVKVSLWNRNNSNVNGAYNITIYGTNTEPTNGDGSTVTSMPSDAVILGTFTGLDGDTKSAAAVMDTVGDTTSGCTRSGSYVANSKNNGFRYIIISSTSWNTDSGKYLAIGRININGKFEA